MRRSIYVEGRKNGGGCMGIFDPCLTSGSSIKTHLKTFCFLKETCLYAVTYQCWFLTIILDINSFPFNTSFTFLTHVLLSGPKRRRNSHLDLKKVTIVPFENVFEMPLLFMHISSSEEMTLETTNWCF